jgi:hypothetical protein
LAERGGPHCELRKAKHVDQPYREIAEALTDRGIKTPRGGDTWNQVTVVRSMRRLGIASK